MRGRSASQSVPCGTFISSTMIVMITAMTPSLNASSRPLVMARATASVRHVHVLDLTVRKELVERVLAPDAAVLVAPERSALEALAAVSVDPDVARLDLIGKAQRRRDVAGPDIRAKAIFDAVHFSEHLLAIVP